MRRIIVISVWCVMVCVSVGARSVYNKELGDTLTAFAGRYVKLSDVVEVERQWVRDGVLYIRTGNNFAGLPFRPAMIRSLKRTIQLMHGEKRFADVVVISDGRRIDEYVPDHCLAEGQRRSAYVLPEVAHPLVKNVSLAYGADKGLAGKHLALWGSHGYYFEQKKNRWEWQRARMLQTVEDLFTSSFTMPFLVPMLENAGAVVMQPRERDVQLAELVVDADTESDGEVDRTNGNERWRVSEDSTGFAHLKEEYYEGDNPFVVGTYDYVQSTSDVDDVAQMVWQPRVTVDGAYSVYVAYKTVEKSTECARYAVHHAGGVTRFEVNQRMAGGTWVYLGTFDFVAEGDGRVVLDNMTGADGEVVTADAVRLGGGRGNVARKPLFDVLADSITPVEFVARVSGRPRYMEAARYWMQWAGVPDSIFGYSEGQSDYLDDLVARGRWVNFVAGGSAANPEQAGWGVPLHLSLGFHTDAGQTKQDSIIGTLMIYTSFNNDRQRLYPTGVDRMGVRTLGDLVQSQIVDDMRATLAPEWMRRELSDKSYAESRYPEVPSLLLELLSHQNFADMRYGHDPRVKFLTSRAVYKGVLKYLHLQYGTDYVVQPLPVSEFAMERRGESGLRLSWAERVDSLESTAVADHYVLYTRKGDGGYDNGVRCDSAWVDVQVEQGVHYSFRVAAANAGGVSLRSETLSACLLPEQRGMALVINGFDRVAAPQGVAVDSTYAGFVPNDNGVPYMYDVSYVGDQYEYDKNAVWTDNDDPGFGASYADYEQVMVAGNTFDYPLIHGRAIVEAGYSYLSCSHTSLDVAKVDTCYDFVDVILGKQRKTYQGSERRTMAFEVFPTNVQDALAAYASAGVDLLVSGAYLGSDLWDDAEGDSLEMAAARGFAQQVLHYTYRTRNASRSGLVEVVSSPIGVFDVGSSFAYFIRPNAWRYQVQDPDAIEPVGEKAYPLVCYVDNNKCAGVVYDGGYKTCVLAFPIEALTTQREVNELMRQVLGFFE